MNEINSWQNKTLTNYKNQLNSSNYKKKKIINLSTLSLSKLLP